MYACTKVKASHISLSTYDALTSPLFRSGNIRLKRVETAHTHHRLLDLQCKLRRETGWLKLIAPSWQLLSFASTVLLARGSFGTAERADRSICITVVA